MFYLEGVFPADVVIHRQHGDVETGQQDTSQDAVLLLICTNKKHEEKAICQRIRVGHAFRAMTTYTKLSGVWLRFSGRKINEDLSLLH